ncbi:MAG: hypothetical protein E6I08_06005 [Chloroflexi bacterium]|nr:MAG: hypothetical protein E6I08_06005 [Chloroflexota bacterium]
MGLPDRGRGTAGRLLGWLGERAHPRHCERSGYGAALAQRLVRSGPGLGADPGRTEHASLSGHVCAALGHAPAGRRSVALHFDPNQGWSTLFPTEWTLSNSGAQTTFTGSGQLMSVVLGNDTSNLPNTPLSAGKEVRQESPVEIYGKTTYITVYQLSAGGFEYDSSAKFSATKSLLFSFRDTAARSGDTGLFKQLLASVIVT